MEREDQYSKLPEYAELRETEVRLILQPYLDVTDQYGRLLCRLCSHVGTHAPVSVQDSVIRDLMADVFDFLFEVRPFIVKGQTLVAYPLARRAYESLSLLQVCILKASQAEKWAAGKKISNNEVRKALGKNPMGESEEELRKLYGFFCDMTHPNRETIAYRGLGEGNEPGDLPALDEIYGNEDHLAAIEKSNRNKLLVSQTMVFIEESKDLIRLRASGMHIRHND